MYKSHGDVFVACMLPNPPDYAKVGGHWDVVLSRYDDPHHRLPRNQFVYLISYRIDHIKEGLVRFFSLIPYDIITLEVWNKVMSHWMEAINVEVSRDDLPELRKDFVKIFDPDMSPLGFDAKVRQ